jgi:hypothetical protein
VFSSGATGENDLQAQQEVRGKQLTVDFNQSDSDLSSSTVDTDTNFDDADI